VASVYCIECQMKLCPNCERSHECSVASHECSDVSEVRDDLCKQMASDIDNVSAGVDRCREMLESLEKKKIKFIQEAEKAGVEICEKTDELKRMIDEHKKKLLSDLSSVKQKTVNDIESLCVAIERQLMSMESYKKYVDEVTERNSL